MECGISNLIIATVVISTETHRQRHHFYLHFSFLTILKIVFIYFCLVLFRVYVNLEFGVMGARAVGAYS